MLMLIDRASEQNDDSRDDNFYILVSIVMYRRKTFIPPLGSVARKLIPDEKLTEVSSSLVKNIFKI